MSTGHAGGAATRPPPGNPNTPSEPEISVCCCSTSVGQACEWLDVSKSGYYEWRSRPQSAAAKRRDLLKIKVKALFDFNNEEYGYRRLHAALARGGERCGPELVRALMRELGLEPCQPRPWRRSLTDQGAAGPIPDLVNRDFTAERPGQKMVGDITYIPTWEGWVYLATRDPAKSHSRSLK